MKKYFMYCLAVFVGHYINLSAQTNCSKYYPVGEGNYVTLSLIDNQSNNEMGQVTYKVIEANGSEVKYSVEMTAGGAPMMSSEYTMYCEEGGVSIEFNNMMTGPMGAMGDVEVSGTNIYLPNVLEVGPLRDAEMTVKTPSMSMTRKMINREVLGTESITTPARTKPFPCIVIQYETHLNMGPMADPIKTKTIEWLSEHVGLVKMEEFEYDLDKNEFKANPTTSGVLIAYKVD